MQQGREYGLPIGRLLSEAWLRTLFSRAKLERVNLGGMGAADGVAIFSDGRVDFRFQRDRNDLFVEARQSATDLWHPLWLILLHVDKSITYEALDSLASEEALREGLDRNWARVCDCLLIDRQRSEYQRFEERWASGDLTPLSK